MCIAGLLSTVRAWLGAHFLHFGAPGRLEHPHGRVSVV